MIPVWAAPVLIWTGLGLTFTSFTVVCCPLVGQGAKFVLAPLELVFWQL